MANAIPAWFEVEEQAGTPCGCGVDGCEADGYPFAFGVDGEFPGYVEACGKHALRLAWETWNDLPESKGIESCRVCGGEGNLSTASPPGPCAACGGKGFTRG